MSKKYPQDIHTVTALQDVSLSIAHGELVAITGSSGSGKTTLMNIMGLLDRPTSGKILIDGQSIPDNHPDEIARLRNRHVGFVFQAFHLLPRLSALDNVALPLLYRGIPIPDARLSAKAQLTRLGLADRITHKPDQLSGGQRQRVAIARALVGEPAILLADEPTGALDSQTAASIVDLFVELNRTQHLTVVIVTHDEAISLRCDRRIAMRDGRVVTDSGALSCGG